MTPRVQESITRNEGQDRIPGVNHTLDAD